MSEQDSTEGVSSLLDSPAVEFDRIKNFFMDSFWEATEETLEFLKFNEMARKGRKTEFEVWVG